MSNSKTSKSNWWFDLQYNSDRITNCLGKVTNEAENIGHDKELPKDANG